MSNIAGIKSYAVNLNQALKQTSAQSAQQLDKIAEQIGRKADAATDVGLKGVERSNAISAGLDEYRSKIDTYA
ncbi:MAG: hypothetical protein ACRCU9_12500 [Iodobacter sp.]